MPSERYKLPLLLDKQSWWKFCSFRRGEDFFFHLDEKILVGKIVFMF